MIKKEIFKVVLIRHGESLGNLENRFTGWLDVDITKKGYLESYKQGIKLKNLKYKFDICYTSKLKRSINTCWAILNAMRLNFIKIKKTKKLNERNYGELSGMNKLEGIIKYGKNKINNWLNNYNQKPPKLKKKNIKYKLLKKNYKWFPLSESLNELSKRVLKFWNKNILKKIKKKNILIVGHSNILKILMNYIDGENKNEILENSKPIIYEFDKSIKKIKKYNI